MNKITLGEDVGNDFFQATADYLRRLYLLAQRLLVAGRGRLSISGSQGMQVRLWSRALSVSSPFRGVKHLGCREI